jgi:hypothetical protein
MQTLQPLQPSAVGVLNYTRYYHRFGNGSAPTIFAQQLLIHESCWRPAVGHMLSEWPAYFKPGEQVDISRMEGAGGYADFRGGNLDGKASKLAEMNFGLNWDGVFPYPYHGMWMPYAPVFNESWQNCFTHPGYDTNPSIFNVSHQWINTYVSDLKELGFNTCMYANLFEFGWNITDAKLEPHMPADCAAPPPSDPFDACHEQTRCHSNSIFRSHFSDAAVRDWRTDEMLQPKGCLGQPCAMMDPAVPSYLNHLIAMTKAVVEKVPASVGLCIDRQDMVGRLNPHGDDNTTWFESTSQNLTGGVAQNTLFSFLTASAALAAELRPAGKGIFINVHTSRLDMMPFVDGIFDEHGDTPANMALSGLLGLAMPVIIWNHGTTSKLDAFLQSHLYYGVNFMAPVPNNDHSVHDDAGDQGFLDYGSMFAQLRSKEWVLVPHAVTVNSGGSAGSLSNLFRVENGFAAPVVFGGAHDSAVSITLRGVCNNADLVHVRVRIMHPGTGNNTTPANYTVAVAPDGWTELTVLVPLVRGCGLVLISNSVE